MIKVAIVLCFVTIINLFSCADNVQPQPEHGKEILENPKIITGKVELKKLPSTDSRLHFELKNGREANIFLAYHKSDDNDIASNFVPYSLRCRALPKDRYESVGPDFHFVPRLSPLASGEHVVFTLLKPDTVGACVISVNYNLDSNAAKLVNEKILTLTPAEEQLIISGQRSVDYEFALE